MFKQLVRNGLRPLQNPVLLRFMSTNTPKIYNFNEMKKLVEHPSAKKVLVDVREPEELKEYKLPKAVNIPLKTSPGALGLPDEEFEDIFKFPKPAQDNELIFFCAKGMRAKAAEELARSYGYTQTGVYPGSITEWLAKGGKDIKPMD